MVVPSRTITKDFVLTEFQVDLRLGGPAANTMGQLTLPPKTKILESDEYTIGWICALPKEALPAVLLLDEEYERLPGQPNDNNSYHFGRIGAHNVVIATLPKGSCGQTSAAAVATNMVRSFRSIRFCLMVGIGAGIPGENDIRLGDIVVGTPQDDLGGVVQYDFGAEYADGSFKRKGHLNAPPGALLTALSTFQINDERGKSLIPYLVANVQKKKDEVRSRFRYPGTELDHLFPPEYSCQSKGNSCEDCDKSHIDIRRTEARQSLDPVIHYGTIASGTKLVRNPTLRDQLMEEYGACCIKMEAAGIMNTFPSLVICGICNYADSHKNNIWQDYAALTAAACAKELLDYVSPMLVQSERTVIEALKPTVRAPGFSAG